VYHSIGNGVGMGESASFFVTVAGEVYQFAVDDGVDVVVWVESAGDEAKVFYSDVDGDDKHYY